MKIDKQSRQKKNRTQDQTAIDLKHKVSECTVDVFQRTEHHAVFIRRKGKQRKYIYLSCAMLF